FESVSLNLNPLGSILEQAESIWLFHCALRVSNKGRTRLGLPQAIAAYFPNAHQQRCITHKLEASHGI
uniref:hypothetical protein n=1 Tax=Phormidesmis priestleyi TaxID=268141 RepID=UPI000ABA5F20